MVALHDDGQLEMPTMPEDGDGDEGGGNIDSELTVESMRMLIVLTVMEVMNIGMMVLSVTVTSGNKYKPWQQRWWLWR